MTGSTGTIFKDAWILTNTVEVDKTLGQTTYSWHLLVMRFGRLEFKILQHNITEEQQASK